MAAEFVTNKNVDAVIAAEAPGHVFAAGTEIWLGQSVALDFLRIFRLSPYQGNGWITGQVFDEMIYFTDIRPTKYKVFEKGSRLQQQPLLEVINLIGD